MSLTGMPAFSGALAEPSDRICHTWLCTENHVVFPERTIGGEVGAAISIGRTDGTDGFKSSSSRQYTAMVDCGYVFGISSHPIVNPCPLGSAATEGPVTSPRY